MELANFIIENNTLALNQPCSTWQEAVKLSVDMLVKAGIVEEAYYEAILKNTKNNGPYYLITDNVAMPHARPENGALKTGCALVTLANPVKYENDEDNRDVRVFIVIAAKDAKELNEKVLVDIMKLIEEPSTVNSIIAAKSGDDIKAIFAKLD